jgi:undecaprenyl-diphosphatase
MALLIGASQALALFPGVSRSGITITTALLLGFSRSTAARFSFLLATPITFGACVLKSGYFLEILYNPHAFLGVATAAFFGFLSIKYLMKLVQKYSYRIFCYYRFAFGFVVMGLYFWRNYL